MRHRLTKHILHGLALGALLPLLAFCGPGDAPPTAVATPGTEEITGAATIYINEILAHTDEPQVDTIELYNPGSQAVDLRDWCVSDDGDDRAKYCVSAPGGNEPAPIIPAGGYFLLTAPEFGFGLSEFGETVYLSAPETSGLVLVDSVEFGVSPNGVSLGRHVSSTGAVHFPLQSRLTLGAANAMPLVAPIAISSIAYDPAQGPEYLVLTSTSKETVLLYDPLFPANTWRITGIGNDGGDYSLPEQTILEPGESLVLTADPGAFAAAFPALTLRVIGPFQGKLNNDGERIELRAPQPPETDGRETAYAVMDAVEYGIAEPWPAAGANGQVLVRKDLLQFGDDPANWEMAPVGIGGGGAKVLLPLVQR